MMIRWTGLAPWEFGFPCSGSLVSISLDIETLSALRAALEAAKQQLLRRVEREALIKAQEQVKREFMIHQIITMIKWIRTSRLSIKVLLIQVARACLPNHDSTGPIVNQLVPCTNQGIHQALSQSVRWMPPFAGLVNPLTCVTPLDAD